MYSILCISRRSRRTRIPGFQTIDQPQIKIWHTEKHCQQNMLNVKNKIVYFQRSEFHIKEIMVIIFKDFFAFFRNQIKVVYVLEETNFGNISGYMRDINSTNIVRTCILGGDINILMKGKLFQRSTHFLYCSHVDLTVLSIFQKAVTSDYNLTPYT